MKNERYLSFYSHRSKVLVDIDAINYVIASDCNISIHMVGGEVHETRMRLGEIEKQVGDNFIRIKRNAIVKASAVESVTDVVKLKNGDVLKFAARQKKRIIDEVLAKSNSKAG